MGMLVYWLAALPLLPAVSADHPGTLQEGAAAPRYRISNSRYHELTIQELWLALLPRQPKCQTANDGFRNLFILRA
jgi:hypothetical protein